MFAIKYKNGHIMTTHKNESDANTHLLVLQQVFSNIAVVNMNESKSVNQKGEYSVKGA
jgi:hypothetical protein